MKNNSDPIIRDLEIMVSTVNYRKWIYSHISGSMGRRVIELGAGIGNFTQLFTDRELVVAVDNSESAVEQMRKKFSDFQNVIPLKIDIEGPGLLELSKYEADTIVCINVLEHIHNDAEVMANMFDILKTGDKVVLLVPAFQFLYGSIDSIVGHHRRYSKKEFSKILTEAGFAIKDIFFMNFIAVLAWFLNNRILKRQEESPAQVLFFDKFIVPWLQKAEHIIRPPFGLSLIAIGEKK